jgi:hypothetical protein
MMRWLDGIANDVSGGLYSRDENSRWTQGPRDICGIIPDAGAVFSIGKETHEKGGGSLK